MQQQLYNQLFECLKFEDPINLIHKVADLTAMLELLDKLCLIQDPVSVFRDKLKPIKADFEELFSDPDFRNLKTKSKDYGPLLIDLLKSLTPEQNASYSQQIYNSLNPLINQVHFVEGAVQRITKRLQKLLDLTYQFERDPLSFASNRLLQGNGGTCLICSGSKPSNMKLVCGHEYHTNCYTHRYKTNYSCVICKIHINADDIAIEEVNQRRLFKFLIQDLNLNVSNSVDYDLWYVVVQESVPLDLTEVLQLDQ